MTENHIERYFKGVWIPKGIWLDRNLSGTEKMLFAAIDSLAENGECFATNEHLARLLGLSRRTITKLLSSLQDKRYVEVTLQYKGETKEIIKSVINTTQYRIKIVENLK